MSSRQTHRGLAPKDDRLFAPRFLPTLRAALSDLCWLLDRGYAIRSAGQLVGNRHNLTGRQRLAIARCACTDEAARKRQARCVLSAELKGQELWLDGYNVLTILESALAGGIVLLGRDGCCRDIAGVHRRHRKVDETMPALRMIGELTAALGVTRCRWWLDKPVSNSGRLKAFILEVAAGARWNADAELTFNPDRILSQTEHVVATSDGVILDRCHRWVNLVRLVIGERIPQARLVDLG